MAEDADQGKIAALSFEKWNHPRVPISIPVLRDALASGGNPSDVHIGVIKEVNQAGLVIELFTDLISGRLSLSFIDVEVSKVQIENRVVHSRIKSFMTWIGSSLASPPPYSARFRISRWGSYLFETNDLLKSY
jgi:hypothetical protein